MGHRDLGRVAHPGRDKVDGVGFCEFRLPRALQVLKRLAPRFDIGPSDDLLIELLQERRTVLNSAAVTGQIDVREVCVSGAVTTQ